MSRIAIPDSVLSKVGLAPDQVAATKARTNHEIATAKQTAAAQRAERLRQAHDEYMAWLSTWSTKPVRTASGDSRPRLSLSTFEKAKTLAQAWFGLIEIEYLPSFGPKIYGQMRGKFKSICRQHLLEDLLTS